MCGIVGIITTGREPSRAIISKMTAMVRHRGPDDRGLFYDNNVALGHCRLSIIDLTNRGHQPMSDDGNRYQIIYNGELYNYKEIRSQLISRGYKFKSDSDTEVVLKSFIDAGKKCLDQFNGISVLSYITDMQNTDWLAGLFIQYSFICHIEFCLPDQKIL